MEELYHIGYVKKAHGLAGTCKIQLHHDLIFEAVKTIFLEQSGELVPYAVAHLGEFYLRLKLIDNIDKAKQLKGCKIFVPKKFIHFEEAPTELDALLGYTVVDETGESLGIVTDKLDNNSSGLLVVETTDREVLIPFVADFILDRDDSKRQLTMTLPDGLLDF